MNFYKTLDLIMRQDIGGRGLLPSLPASPLAETAAALSGAKRAVLLTGFPVRLADGSFIGETDGPSGTAAAAAALNGIGCHTAVVTDSASYPLLKEALRWMAPQTSLVLLPKNDTAAFIRNFLSDFRPTHFISLERPGKAADGHYHNMRGEIIDDMIADSSPFLSEAKKLGAVTFPSETGAMRWEWALFTGKLPQMFHAALKFVPVNQPILRWPAVCPTGGDGGWLLFYLLKRGVFFFRRKRKKPSFCAVLLMPEAWTDVPGKEQ